MKKWIFVFGAGIAVISLLVVFFLTRTSREGLSIGKYDIAGNDKYPNAYIEVTDNTIQFFNIDLNEYYQAEQMRVYRMVLDNDPGWYGTVSDDELRSMADLNAVFIEKPYDYSQIDAKKIGTNLMAYLMLYHDNFLGLAIHYNTKTKHIDVMRDGVILSFEKEE